MNEFVFTALGQQLVSRMIAGEATATFTRAETSDREYAKSEVETLAALTDVKQEALISKVTRLDQTKVELLIALDNKSLTETYSVKAIGVYAKDSDQQEILFGVAVNTETPDPMPALTGQTISELTYHLVIAVAVSDQIEISVNPSVGATVEQLEELEGAVNEKVEQLVESDRCLNEKLDAAINGFEAKTTVFNDDGSITETDGSGYVKKTTFNSDGSITETLSGSDSTLIATKTTTFHSDGSITEEVTK